MLLITMHENFGASAEAIRRGRVYAAAQPSGFQVQCQPQLASTPYFFGVSAS